MNKLFGYVCALAVSLLVVNSSSAATITVNQGGDLQAAINSAQPGDTILLQAGATFTGNFYLPLKAGTSTSYITIRSSAADTRLPAAGVRMAPSYAAYLPKIRGAGSAQAFRSKASTHHWKFQYLEIIGNAQGINEVVQIGTGSETTTAALPHHIIFDRVYIHGDLAKGARRGLTLNTGAVTVRDSYINEIKQIGIETQCLGGWNGIGPYLIENNYLSAAGVNIMFGGATPKIPNLVPSDITVRRNLLTKDLRWRGSSYTVKGLFELKNAQRVVVEGNRFQYAWEQDQKGYAITLMPWNNGYAPWTVVQDVTIRNNRFDHVASGITIVGTHKVNGVIVSKTTSRIAVLNNLLTDVSKKNWGGHGAFMVSGSGATDVRVDHNTVIHDGAVLNGNGKGNVRFVFTNNLMKHNVDGIYGDGLGPGFVSLDKYFIGVVLRRNVLAGGVASKYPSDNFFPPTSEFLGNFVNASAGDYHLAVSSPYRAAGTDSKDIGADVDKITAASR
jgi:hypothetical protein